LEDKISLSQEEESTGKKSSYQCRSKVDPPTNTVELSEEQDEAVKKVFYNLQ